MFVKPHQVSIFIYLYIVVDLCIQCPVPVLPDNKEGLSEAMRIGFADSVDDTMWLFDCGVNSCKCLS